MMSTRQASILVRNHIKRGADPNLLESNLRDLDGVAWTVAHSIFPRTATLGDIFRLHMAAYDQLTPKRWVALDGQFPPDR